MTRPAAPTRTAAPSRRRRATPDADPRPSPGNITPGTRDFREGAETTVTIGPVSDALDKLQAEHRLLTAILQRGTRSMPRLREAFERHIQVEDAVFYPALRRAGGKKTSALIDRADREHAAAAALIDRLATAPVAQRARLAHGLRETLEEHVRVEEQEIFPLALRVLPRPERVRLGEEMDLLQARERNRKARRRGTRRARSAG
jgi:hemerythrin-like domain-containing protein